MGGETITITSAYSSGFGASHRPESRPWLAPKRLEAAYFSPVSAILAKEKMEAINHPADDVAESEGRSARHDFERSFDELTRWDTLGECVGGCGIGWAIYFVLAGLGIASGTSLGGLIVMLVVSPLLIIIGFLVGSFSGWLVAALVAPLNASVGWPLGSLSFSFVAGGLAGFFPFLFPLLSNPLGETELYMAIIYGPLPAMFLTHVFAYWLTRRTIDNHNDRPAVVPHQPRYRLFRSTRFSIKQLMIFTIWIAAGFALLGLLSPESRWVLAKGYFVAQLPAALLAMSFLWVLYKFKRKKKRNKDPIAAPQV